jgi:hypothetical protein
MAPTASNYIGRAIQEVRRELAGLGIAVRITEREVGDRPPGVVIDQSVPPTGSLSDGITLTASKGPTLVPINEAVVTENDYCTNSGWESGSVTIKGQTSDQGHFVKWTCDDTKGQEHNVSFVLSGRYRRFQVRAGVLDSSPYEGPFRVRVTGDTKDRVLQEKNVRLGDPLDLDVDVTAFTRVTVSFTLPSDLDEPSVGVGQARGNLAS